jgi:hypothetical protein
MSSRREFITLLSGDAALDAARSLGHSDNT